MDIKRIIAATILSALILIGFDYFMPKPHEDAHPDATKISAPAQLSSSAPSVSGEEPASAPEARRIPVQGTDVEGSINLRGALLDDLVLTKYRETLAKDSPLVRLLDHDGSSQPNFVVIGWNNAAGSNARVPDVNTVWESSDQKLAPDHPVTLHWDNGAGLLFTIHVALDQHYMFSVKQEVANSSGQPVALLPFQRVERNYLPSETGSFTAHEGPIAVMNGRLQDESYKNLHKGGDHPDHTYWAQSGNGGWGGISDKYWLTAIAADPDAPVTATFGYVPGEKGSYRIGFVSQNSQQIMPGASLAQASHVFAGAKVDSLLEGYAHTLRIPDFDKAIDFGWFSFLTRPMLHLLHWLYSYLGNFGLALMALTLIVKIILFPLASKAAASSARMRLLSPKVQEIREKGKDDPLAMNQKIMALYRQEGVNPAGGCLPILIQAPIIFCLYKILNISIDERHAPFFGWIRDLSVPDPTNLLNLFGLLPFDPTSIAPYLHISIWGTALGITFWLLQRQTMVTMDPAQAKIMQFMPLVYVFFMSSFPSGLLVYYTWNNLLTFAQQSYIQRRTKLPVPVTR